VPLLEPTRGVSSFDDEPEGTLFITTDDDLCLFGVGIGGFRSIGAEYLISDAPSDLDSAFVEVGVGAPIGVEVLVCSERLDFDSKAMSVAGCIVCFLVFSEGRFSCGEICGEVGFPCFFSPDLGLLPSYDDPVVSSVGRSAEDTPAII